MAKTMSRKSTATKKAEPKVETKPEVKKVEVEYTETPEEVVAKPKATAPKVVEKKEYSATDVIGCKSIFNGEMLFIGKKSNNLYRWSNYGDVELIEYQDLVYELRAAGDKSVAMIPRFIILDDDLVKEYPRLVTVYNRLYDVNDLKEILLLPPTEMASVIKQLPAPVKDTVKGLAATMIETGELDSLSAINTIDKVLGTSLNLTFGGM